MGELTLSNNKKNQEQSSNDQSQDIELELLLPLEVTTYHSTAYSIIVRIAAVAIPLPYQHATAKTILMV